MESTTLRGFLGLEWGASEQSEVGYQCRREIVRDDDGCGLLLEKTGDFQCRREVGKIIFFLEKKIFK